MKKIKLSEPLLEAIKEFIRTFILGVIPIVGAVLLFIKAGIDTDNGTFNINWVGALAVLVAGVIGVVQTALMSAFDKWVHKNDIKTPLDLESLDSLKEKE